MNLMPYKFFLYFSGSNCLHSPLLLFLSNEVDIRYTVPLTFCWAWRFLDGFYCFMNQNTVGYTQDTKKAGPAPG